MASEENKNGSENNLTITFLSNTSHKSLYRAISTMNLFKQLNEALEFAEFVKSQKFKAQNFSSHCLPACLYTLIDLPPKLLGI